MLSGHLECQLLKMLVHATQARQVLDVGMFTESSALAMAEAMPDGGRVVACEVYAEWRGPRVASACGDRIDVWVGPAAETLWWAGRRR